MTEHHQALITSRAVHAMDKARLLAAGSPHSGDWLHAPHIASVGLRLSDETVGLRWLTDLDARPVNRTAAYVGLGIGVQNCYIPCHWFASCPWKQCGAIRLFAILLQETRWLFDHWYLGSFDCPAEDVVHVMMALVSGSTLAAGQTM